MYKFKLLAIFLLLALGSCSRYQEDEAIAQMRMRAMQTRAFVSVDAKTVMKEMVAVLQDEGFIIKTVSNDLGLLTAERDTKIEKFSSKFWAYILSGSQARWKKHSLLEMTSNVTEEEGKTKIRVNFLVRVYDNLGRVIDVHQIMNEDAYLEFFTKVQKGLVINQK